MDITATAPVSAPVAPAKAETKTPPSPTPAPAEVKPETPTPARPRISFSSLRAEERLLVCRVARNQVKGGALPLEVRRAILADYEGIPESSFSPDPTGEGWADKLAAGAEKALIVVLGLAAGAMGLLLLVETGKAILRATGAMAPAPKALPENPAAPDEVGIEGATHA